MKKLIIAVIIIAALGYSCNIMKTRELKGIYSIGGFRMQENVNMDTLKQSGVLNFGEAPFNFILPDSVILDQRFGKTFFGASAFKYELTNKTLTFINGDKRIEMDYLDDGVFRLNIQNPYLARLDLVPQKENK